MFLYGPGVPSDMSISEIVSGLSMALDHSIPIGLAETKDGHKVSGVSIDYSRKLEDDLYRLGGTDAAGVKVFFDIEKKAENPQTVVLRRGEAATEVGTVSFCRIGSSPEKVQHS